MTRTLIRGGTVVTASDTFTADVWIEDGKISGLVAVGTAPFGDRSLTLTGAAHADLLIEAGGCYVIPGGIDAHTHMELPFGGTTASDDFATGTIAAAHGGTTTILDFAIQSKGGSMRAGLDTWYAKAEGKAAIDYGFHLIMTEANPSTLEEMGSLDPHAVASWAQTRQPELHDLTPVDYLGKGGGDNGDELLIFSARVTAYRLAQ